MRPGEQGRRGGSVHLVQGHSTDIKRTARLSANHKLAQLSILDSASPQLTIFSFHRNQSRCLAEAREAKDLEREVPSVTGKSFVTTSKALPSLPSAVWLAVEA